MNATDPVIVEVESDELLAGLQVADGRDDVIVEVEGVEVGKGVQVLNGIEPTEMQFECFVELGGVVSIMVFDAYAEVLLTHEHPAVFFLDELLLFLHESI